MLLSVFSVLGTLNVDDDDGDNSTIGSFRVKSSKILIQPDITDSDLLEILNSCFHEKKVLQIYFYFSSSVHWNTGR